ncbi:MAG: M1 family metallopeptidase, partial [Chitinophagaceae bacterium]|nr:M1 family metallopeptidase [Chitinophagaceae bacterium]
MKEFVLRFAVTLCIIISGQALNAQEKQSSRFHPGETFSPLLFSANTSELRSASGKPAPGYWQNRADYRIDVKLDTSLARIEGMAMIHYINNSPDKLEFLWLNLDQNFRKKNSRDAAARFSMYTNEGDLFSNGVIIDTIFVQFNNKTYTPSYIVNDTRLQLRLPFSLPARGGKIDVHIKYSFDIVPTKIGSKMGITETRSGKIFQIAQWYPRMAVYDDLEGWNISPYIYGSEFYLDYGDIDFNITVPANMIVTASGELLNKTEVLSGELIKKLKSAELSDSTIIITRPSMKLANNPGKFKTWKFRCINARDVAWAASAAFIWDAARINLPGGKKAVAMSFYPEECSEVWQRSTSMIKYSVELFSVYLNYPYTYPTAGNVAGMINGMEYPGIVFCNKEMGAEDLFSLVAHEFGHNWFPIIVGSNEKKYAWMDEGLTRFFEKLAVSEYGNKKPKQDSISSWEIRTLFNNNDNVNGGLMNWPSISSDSYNKTAMGLSLLRNVILGSDRFQYAMQQYVNNWAFKHPSPYDFFNSISDAAGEDLDWFWRSLFFNDWKLDQEVYSIEYTDTTDYSKG